MPSNIPFVLSTAIFALSSLSGCDAIQEKRNQSAFETLLSESYNSDNGLKVSYCLDSGKLSYASFYESYTPVQQRLKSRVDYLRILDCYKSEQMPSGFAGEFEIYKSLHEEALNRYNQRQKEIREDEDATREITQIKEYYRKFIGVTDERSEVVYSREQFQKYQYCVVNPAYRDSLDVKLRTVDILTDPSDIIRCVRKVNIEEIDAINVAISVRYKREQELVLQKMADKLAKSEK